MLKLMLKRLKIRLRIWRARIQLMQLKRIHRLNGRRIDKLKKSLAKRESIDLGSLIDIIQVENGETHYVKDNNIR